MERNGPEPSAAFSRSCCFAVLVKPRIYLHPGLDRSKAFWHQAQSSTYRHMAVVFVSGFVSKGLLGFALGPVGVLFF